MAAHLSEEENYLRTITGGDPEYVPTYKMMEWGCFPSAFMPPRPEDGSNPVSLFGVESVIVESAGGGGMPKPGVILLDDIRKWRDVIKRPPILDEIDWEKMAKKDLDKRDPKLLKTGGGGVSMGYFQALVSFMGFTEALIACIEEPDEVKELLNFLLEINLETGKKYLQYYKPDVYSGFDDIAHERAPFVSLDVFLDLFEPVWRAEITPFKEAGLPAQHHNCGKFELFVPYIVDMGYDAWDPAQDTNDLLGIKQTYGRRLTICTGFQSNGFMTYPETTEEEIRAEVRRVMDLYSPGGAYCFIGHILGPLGDEETAIRNGWIKDEYEKNKFNYYS